MKRIFPVLLCGVIFVLLFPLTVHASGGYIAVKGKDSFHDASYCGELEGVYVSELIWFDTLKQAEASGRKACDLCVDEYSRDYEESVFRDSFFSGNNKLMSAILEYENMIGQETGYEAGYSNGQEDVYIMGIQEEAYELGFEDGYAIGQSDIQKENDYFVSCSSHVEETGISDDELKEEKSKAHKKGFYKGCLLLGGLWVFWYLANYPLTSKRK